MNQVTCHALGYIDVVTDVGDECVGDKCVGDKFKMLVTDLIN